MAHIDNVCNTHLRLLGEIDYLNQEIKKLQTKKERFQEKLQETTNSICDAIDGKVFDTGRFIIEINRSFEVNDDEFDKTKIGKVPNEFKRIKYELDKKNIRQFYSDSKKLPKELTKLKIKIRDTQTVKVSRK